MKKINKIKKEHKLSEDVHEAWRGKILHELEQIIEADFPKECDKWQEGCAICEIYRALANIKRIYEKN